MEQVAYTLASGEKVSLTAGSELAGDGDEADSASYETVWRFAGDADTDLDQDKVQSMLSALSSYVSGQITPPTARTRRPAALMPRWPWYR